jgi:hypothetical protein
MSALRSQGTSTVEPGHGGRAVNRHPLETGWCGLVREVACR